MLSSETNRIKCYFPTLGSYCEADVAEWRLIFWKFIRIRKTINFRPLHLLLTYHIRYSLTFYYTLFIFLIYLLPFYCLIRSRDKQKIKYCQMPSVNDQSEPSSLLSLSLVSYSFNNSLQCLFFPFASPPHPRENFMGLLCPKMNLRAEMLFDGLVSENIARGQSAQTLRYPSNGLVSANKPIKCSFSLNSLSDCRILWMRVYLVV